MSLQRERATFLNALRRATAELDTSDNPRDFAFWSLTYIRTIEPRELRHAACDGILAALDDRDEP
jgi:hypothetical protein